MCAGRRWWPVRERTRAVLVTPAGAADLSAGDRADGSARPALGLDQAGRRLAPQGQNLVTFRLREDPVLLGRERGVETRFERVLLKPQPKAPAHRRHAGQRLVNPLASFASQVAGGSVPVLLVPIAFSALGFLPSVVVHSLIEGREIGGGRRFVNAAIGLSYTIKLQNGQELDVSRIQSRLLRGRLLHL